MLVLPLLAAVWARAADRNVPLRLPASPEVGWAAASAGLLLTLWGMNALVRIGRGLPMNIAPPPVFVRIGPYAWLRHPIYTGFTLTAFGVSLAARSAAGFWLVSPAVALGCGALVLGYEARDLQRRFGTGEYRPWISLPEDTDSTPPLERRLGTLLLVLLPWAAVYQALTVVGSGSHASAALPLETNWPVLEWTEVLYASAYVGAVTAPFAAKRCRDLRNFARGGLLATALVGFLFVLLPLQAVPRPFQPSGPAGRLLAWERAHDVPWNAFPSFHVVWALLAARAFGSRWPRWRGAFFGWAALVSASCVATGMHAVADVVGGVAVYAAVARADRVWDTLRSAAERVANSWREWRVGPVRIISHSIYAGTCGFAAILIVGTLLGPESLLPAFGIAALGVVCAAVSAQAIEGSSKLLRPYGYFGAVAGVVIGCFLVPPPAGAAGLAMLAAFCVAAPAIVAVGRLRCLVQGCCHGYPTHSRIGIRYTHPMSRVTRLAELRDVPVHPTPLYSILWNAAILLLLVRLWAGAASFSIVAGAYFLLSGFGRFVEEAFRGEPQTPIPGGLRLYQWFAMAHVFFGAVLTALPSTPAGGFHLAISTVLVALGFGLLTAAAYGLDVPRSNVRFARLT